MEDIRILLVDNHELIHRGMQSVLEQEEDMKIVGDCSSTEEALLKTETLSPDIILMDAKISGIGGIEITRQLRQKQIAPNVIMLTLSEDRLSEALEAGASGYLLEDINSQELIQAIRKVYHGELVIDERLTSKSQAGKEGTEYLLEEDDNRDLLIREADLIIPPPCDAALLLRFICQVEEVLTATILQEVGSWNKGIVITVVPRTVTTLAAILDGLGQLPEVEEIKEKPAAKHTLFGFPKKLTLGPETHPRRELLVTLKKSETFNQPDLSSDQS